MINCRFCQGDRPVCPETHRCKGCGMSQSECVYQPDPAGKRACPDPTCGSNIVEWINNFKQLTCVVCGKVFGPRRV
jgi:hypothetical protein